MDKFDIQVERNLRGIELEKSGQIDKAIELYEENVRERFEGSHPYRRFAIIYRKLGMIEDEIRILEEAISVFYKVAKGGRSDGLPKLNKFKERLLKVVKLSP